MARHGFGRGEYKYYRYPLPPLIAELRPRALRAARADRQRLAVGARAPPSAIPTVTTGFLARCRAAGQSRPTPLILRYGPGDYNCLHQDVYGETVFPLQVAVLLSSPSAFLGRRVRAHRAAAAPCSRAPEVVPLEQGDAVIFPVRDRPVRGARGFYRAQHRHGVSELRSGQRHTLGIIFHDAA